jgi:hypothetical protein
MIEEKIYGLKSFNTIIDAIQPTTKHLGVFVLCIRLDIVNCGVIWLTHHITGQDMPWKHNRSHTNAYNKTMFTVQT